MSKNLVMLGDIVLEAVEKIRTDWPSPHARSGVNYTNAKN